MVLEDRVSELQAAVQDLEVGHLPGSVAWLGKALTLVLTRLALTSPSVDVARAQRRAGGEPPGHGAAAAGRGRVQGRRAALTGSDAGRDFAASGVHRPDDRSHVLATCAAWLLCDGTSSASATGRGARDECAVRAHDRAVPRACEQPAGRPRSVPVRPHVSTAAARLPLAADLADRSCARSLRAGRARTQHQGHHVREPRAGEPVGGDAVAQAGAAIDQLQGASQRYAQACHATPHIHPHSHVCCPPSEHLQPLRWSCVAWTPSRPPST